MGIISIGISFARGLIKSKAGKTVVTQVAKKATTSGTRVLTGTSGITKMEREINYAGKKALATVEVLPDGTRNLHITGGGDNPIYRTTTITRKPKSNIFGGDEIVISKDTSKYWCYNEKQTLTKQYSPNGVLEHKELNFAHSSGNGLNDYTHVATQDRLYNEVNLTNSAEDMYKVKPYDSRNIMHSLDGEANYGTKSVSNYEKAIAAQKQAKIDAAKKAEEEAIAAQKAAEEAAAKLKAEAPKLNPGRILGRDLSSLKKTEIPCKNGKTIRLYRDPETNKLLLKTEDQGTLHPEWFYNTSKGDFYLKQVGKNNPYVVVKNGNYTQIHNLKNRSCISDYLLHYQGPDGTIKWNLRGETIVGNVGKVNVTTGNKTQQYKVGNGYVENKWKDGAFDEAGHEKAKQVYKKAANDAKSKVLDIYRLLQDYV
jgi:hypothetical protein